ncbi:MAG: YihA family ribosome biogenesis GTP-binding protein [Parasporobacterium sp.]|nr:YihA family ribosome biogenesis GTP-binding protein [Parasporobacterium sp.]
MIIKTVELETVLGPASILPESTLPEIAFAGRSNVGKSSLINGLLNRKKLARTSSQPGKTQTINFYNVNKELYFVDLPGYGFAKVSRDEQVRWGKMINHYLQNSEALKAVFLLVDIRHEVKTSDKEMLDWILSSKAMPIIIATKSDKIKRSQLPGHLKMIRDGLGVKNGTIPVFSFSAETKQGREEILEIISSFIPESE